MKMQGMAFFNNYKNIIYTDHKLELKQEHIEKLLSAREKPIVIRQHHADRENIWEEFGEAMLQERYFRYMSPTIKYIREKIKQGYVDDPCIVWTSLIMYQPQAGQVRQFVDEIYNDLLKIPTAECQIVWPMVAQKYSDIIQIVRADFLDIKWGIPADNEYSAHFSIINYIKRLITAYNYAKSGNIGS